MSNNPLRLEDSIMVVRVQDFAPVLEGNDIFLTREQLAAIQGAIKASSAHIASFNGQSVRVREIVDALNLIGTPDRSIYSFGNPDNIGNGREKPLYANEVLCSRVLDTSTALLLSAAGALYGVQPTNHDAQLKLFAILAENARLHLGVQIPKLERHNRVAKPHSAYFAKVDYARA